MPLIQRVTLVVLSQFKEGQQKFILKGDDEHLVRLRELRLLS